jgi:hypothetical protein
MNQNSSTADRLAARAAMGPAAMAGDYAALAIMEGQHPRQALQARQANPRPAATAAPRTADHEPSKALWARIAALPEPLRADASKLARQGWDATFALRQVYEGSQAAAKLKAGMKLNPGETLAAAYHIANGLRAAAGLPLREIPVISDHIGKEPTEAERAHFLETAAKFRAMYGR